MLAFVGLTAVQAVNNADIWFHLEIGKQIIRNHTFPQTDFMSHTASGREWIVHSWGYGVIAYLLESRLGIQSLVFLRLAIAIILVLTLLKTARLRGAGLSVSALTTAAAFYIISIAWIDRPHLLGSWFTTLLMLILTYYQKGRTHYIYSVPPLLILWANTHASLPLATALMLILLVTSALEDLLRVSTSTYPREHPRINYRLLGLLIPVSFTTSLINPYHLKIYEYFFKINSIVTQNIFEWLPLSQFFADPYVRAFLIFVLIYVLSLVITIITKPQKVSLFEIALFLILTYLSFSALRHMVIFTLIMTPFLSKNLSYLYSALKKKLLRYHSSRRLLKKLVATAAFSTLVLGSIKPARAIIRGTWGLPNTLLPVEAVDFVARVKPQGNMYNHFNWGGYLLWKLFPEYRTFVDGRLDMFVPDIYKEWLAVALEKEGWRQILEKYGVGWIIFPSEGIWDGLREDLENNGDWCLIFWDDYATIAAKKELNPEICRKYGYRAITPFNPTMPARPEDTVRAEEEYKRAILSSPKNASAHSKLGVLYSLEGKSSAAKEEFLKAKGVNPRYATPYYNLGCLAEEEKPQEALSYFKTTVKLNPKFAPAYKKIALIYGRRLGDKERAKKFLTKYSQIVASPEEKAWAREEISRLERNIYLLETP